MPIDVSMYQPTNQLSPVDIAAKWAATQNAVNQNRLFPGVQQLQSQEIKKGEQGIQSNQIGIDKQTLDLINSRYQVVNGVIGSLAAKPGVTKDDVLAEGQKLVDMGFVPAEMLKQTLSNMPEDQTKLPQYLGQVLNTTMSAQEKANLAYGSPTVIDTGQAKQPISISPTKGIRSISEPIQNLPTPTEMNAPAVIGLNERGQKIIGTERERITRATGIDPVTRQPVNTQQPYQQPGGGIITELAPGEGENMQASAKAWQDARQYVAGDNNTPNGSAQRLLTLNSALKGLKNASETGPGSATLNEMKSFIYTIAPSAGQLVGINPEQIASYDEANKYLTAYASQTAGAMGSDSKLATALSGNANTHISNLAAQEVVKANIALERAKMTQVSIFQKLGGTPEGFTDWAAEMNRNIDPRAFTVDLIDADKRKKMLSSMSADQKKKFFESMRLGIEAGVLDPAALGGEDARKQ